LCHLPDERPEQHDGPRRKKSNRPLARRQNVVYESQKEQRRSANARCDRYRYQESSFPSHRGLVALWCTTPFLARRPVSHRCLPRHRWRSKDRRYKGLAPSSSDCLGVLHRRGIVAALILPRQFLPAVAAALPAARELAPAAFSACLRWRRRRCARLAARLRRQL